MTKAERVVKGLNCHAYDYCDDCPYVTDKCSTTLALNAQRLIEQMRHQIEDTKSCILCANYCLCDSDSKMLMECRGSEKKNWMWKGVDLE